MYHDYMGEKITGYLLLIAGLVVMFYCGYNVYQVLTRKSQPVQFFNFKGISINTNQILTGSLPPELKQYIQQDSSTSGQISEIVPAQILNDSSNLFAHFMLMGFFTSIGYKIASLGVMLVRPVVVKYKLKETASTAPNIPKV